MTRLFAGGEMGAFVPSTASVYESSSSGLFYDSAFARCGIFVGGSTSYADSFEFAGQTDIWIHGEVYNLSVFGNLPFLGLLNASGTEVYQIRPVDFGASSLIWQMYRWNGSAFVTHGSTVTVSDARQTYDLHVDIANDTVKLYISGTLRVTASGTDLSGMTDIAQIRLRSSNQSIHSQIIAQTTSTIGQRLMTAPVTGTGATDQWTSSYTSVDEMVYSDSDFIFSDTPAQVEMMTVTPVGALTGYSIAAWVVTARANTDGSGPANLRLAVRSGTTNYFSGSDLPLDAGYGAFVGVWEEDPDTTLAWTTTSPQVGVKSIA